MKSPGVTEFAKKIADRRVKDGGPAFPFHWEDEGAILAHVGMSLRDHFAGQALSGLSRELGVQLADGSTTAFDMIAGLAYQMADAMLAERER